MPTDTAVSSTCCTVASTMVSARDVRYSPQTQSLRCRHPAATTAERTPPATGETGAVTATLQAEVRSATVLRFDDGSPVRAASAVTAYEGGWLVVQDDATHGAWWVGDAVRRVRVFPPVEGHETFSSAEGTKELKPDLEAGCPVPGGVLLLGSGSTSRRMRGALLRGADEPVVADLTPVYEAVLAAMGLDAALLNLEGACLVGPSLRWFQRGVADVPSMSVDLPLEALLACFDRPDRAADRVPVTGLRTYDLGRADGVPLAVTDALALPDGTVLVSAAAEDTDDPYEDGTVVASALALLDDDGVRGMTSLPEVGGEVLKVEGLAPRDVRGDRLEVLAVVDVDDPETPSTALTVEVRR